LDFFVFFFGASAAAAPAAAAAVTDSLTGLLAPSSNCFSDLLAFVFVVAAASALALAFFVLACGFSDDSDSVGSELASVLDFSTSSSSSSSVSRCDDCCSDSSSLVDGDGVFCFLLFLLSFGTVRENGRQEASCAKLKTHSSWDFNRSSLCHSTPRRR
jgi:hypothetical protein